MIFKKLGKSFLCSLLERQVKKLRTKNDLTLIAVAGSVGKTSTKLAIAKTLSVNKKVIYQDGNYNDRLTVPLILFNQTQPGLYNLKSWTKIYLDNRRQLKTPYPYNVAIVEIGTDAPGQLKHFAYLKPDILVLTAIADEHMANFSGLDQVASEELVPLSFSKKALLNLDDIPSKYLPKGDHLTYGLSAKAKYYSLSSQQRNLQSQHLTFVLPETKFEADVAALGNQGSKIALAAVAVADILGLPADSIKTSLKAIQPVPGRMQILAGLEGSLIIDDTYNASPLAVAAALDVLYAAPAAKRIAILGSMNELGSDSQKLHEKIGNYCDPKKLDLLVTIGKEAADYLAPTAEQAGLEVKSYTNPAEAGEYVKTKLQPDTVILVKGSQNGVFAEEAVKVLLANATQARKLVRQSPDWLKIKQKQFPN